MGEVKKVRVIPATISPFTSAPLSEQRKRRTAGYARVSTDNIEQETSFEAQVGYYTDYIKSRADWQFVTVYTDDGISATSTAKRDGFNNMVADALAGELDLIITKSVSRFARNTVDSLTTIRKLKEKGVEVFFEKENIWTFDTKGELLITIMSSMAQEESRSISENVKWGLRKRCSDGKFSVAYSRFLGYDKGEDGGLVINEEQAKLVRRIYSLFLDGLTPHTIAKTLTAENIITPGGKDKWSISTIKSVLTNEKMKGDALLQKSYTPDFLTKKLKINEGEIQQYYVEKSHPAIIEPAVFDMVQIEIQRRAANGRYSGVGIFAGKIKCGCCGSWYGAKKWHSNTKYARTVYQCNSKFKNGCTTPHFYEDDIKRLFISAVNKLLCPKTKAEIIENFEQFKATLFDLIPLEKERDEARAEMSVTAEMVQRCIDENARSALDQYEYVDRYTTLTERYETAKTRFIKISERISDKETRGNLLGLFILELKSTDGLLTDFDSRLWCSLVDYVVVTDEVKFVFKNGMEI